MTKFKAIKSDSRTINAIRKADQIQLSAEGGKSRKGTLPMVGIGDSYKGYFKVTDSSDEVAAEVTISAGNIILGLNTLVVSEDTLVITESGFIYYDVEYDGGYTVTPAFLATFPEQLIDSYALVLAQVVYTPPVLPAVIGSLASITQLHYGIHYGAGRVF